MSKRRVLVNQKGKKNSNCVRIIAGQWRGRRLPVVDVDGLRPTTDRVRETVFNWLMQDIAGARCLDLYAGTGVLGFESLSRGASKVVWVEASAKAAGQLNANLLLLDPQSEYQVASQRVESYLSRPSAEAFDIVFIDPPYKTQCQSQICDLLEAHNWLNEGALIYVEQQAKADTEPAPENWRLYRQNEIGQSRFSLYIRD